MFHDTSISRMQNRVIKVISKEPNLRTNQEIDFVLPWLRKKSDLLNNIDKGFIPLFLCAISIR